MALLPINLGGRSPHQNSCLKTTIISKLVGMIKKRIVVRTDQSIRKTEDEARKLLITLVPKDAKLQATIFDTATGEFLWKPSSG